MSVRPPRTMRALVALLSIASLAGRDVTAQPAAESTAATRDELAGLRFRHIGPAAMSGRFVDLAVYEAAPHVFYAASSTGGLWKTVNGGTTFTSHFEREGTHSIGAIALDQRDTSIVWVGTGERANRQSSSWGDGVYRSVDGGRTFTHRGLRASAHIGRIVLHPTDPNVVYVAAMGRLWAPNPERGLYRTRDAGATWERVLFVDENTGVVDVAMHPSQPDVLYAASYQRRRTPFGFDGGGPGSALWKSTDGGDTWTKLTTGMPTGDIGRIGIAIFRRDPRIVYASVEQGRRYTASTAYEEPLAGLYRSDDAGATWTQQSTWNPRPMYGSQVIVDPNDDCRIYMINFFSTSDDCGKTSRRLPQSLHGDDRFLWIDPADSDHLIKADDGGLGISHDRARTWTYLPHLPVSQYYRVSYDLRTPYRVYGGLQDNGSWAGPSATYRSDGIVNTDWIRWGGGDGFFNVVDTSDDNTLYTASQYLGLSRVDLATGERTDIRPGDPQGAISDRRNWTTFGAPATPEPAQRLGNAMAPANWDAPLIISHHDPHTIYAGTNILWRSVDRGESWTALGDRTTGIDRRTLRIMGNLPDSTRPSLDDGIPYWPTISAIAESRQQRGVLWVGTDDGNVQRSGDGGSTWRELADRLPGLARGAWINGIEPSHHVAGRVYVVANDYRRGDEGNYVYVTDDDGATFRRIDGGLPAARVARTLREDPVNGDVLYLATEFGVFVSTDRGTSWTELTGGLPLMAINDLFVHPREHDLVLGTHSRGVFILDNVAALREVTPAVRRSAVHAFSTRPAEQIRYREEFAHSGDMIFHGENPAEGGLIDVWLRAADSLDVIVRDAAGDTAARLRRAGRAGMNRVVWNLAYSEPGDDPRRAPGGPPVVPGPYTITVRAGGATSTTTLDVRPDPRSTADPAVRAAWVAELQTLSALRRDVRRASAAATRALTALGEGRTDERAAASERARELGELASRIGRLYGEVSGRVGPLTAQQASQKAYYTSMAVELLR